MAETSGFFDAQLIEGEYDRVYYAEQFANYFRLLVGNGVFINPTNQLKVYPVSGMEIKISKGWAFINGYWYHNDEDKIIEVPSNNTSSQRTDSIKLRYSISTRDITADIYVDETDVSRSEARYELKLAEITVPSYASVIADYLILDTRPTNECGFVKGLIDVVDTHDLFSQYNNIFNNWFESIQNIVNSTRFIEMVNTVDGIMDGDLVVPEATNAVDALNASKADNANHALSADEASHAETANEAVTATSANTASSVDNDFILLNKGNLEFVEKVCTITNDKITKDSLADVYFDEDSMKEAEKADVSVETYDGSLILTSARQPATVLKATIKIRVV